MCCIQIQCIKLLHDSSASQIVVFKQFYLDFEKYLSIQLTLLTLNVDYRCANFQ